MRYVLGLDIGISSVGFAVCDLTGKKIEHAGVHLFERPEVPKTGASLASQRSAKRRQRRQIKRKRQRRDQVRLLLAEFGFPTDELSSVISRKDFEDRSNKTLWDIRAEAVERSLADDELAAVLFHIAKHRGFQSNRKRDRRKDEETGKINKAIESLRAEYQQADCKTIGQYLAWNKEHQRNRVENYEFMITRSLLIEEAQLIFEKQREFGQMLPEEFEQQFVEFLRFQRPLQSTEDLVGFCSLLPSEKRAPQSTPSAERFKLLQKINDLSIKDQFGEEWLNESRRLELIKFCERQARTSFDQIRRHFEIPPNYQFNLVRYDSKISDPKQRAKKDKDKEKNLLLGNLECSFKLSEILEDGDEWSREQIDQVAHILTYQMDDLKLTEFLESSLPDASAQQIEQLSELDFDGTINISLAAIYRLLPHMEKGKNYYEACQLAKLPEDNSGDSHESILSPFEDLRNPVVNRALSQARKVINAVLRKYGPPTTIRIELARELGKSVEQRKEISKRQDENKKESEKVRQEFQNALGFEPKKDEALRYRLWKEQGGCCPYSGKCIPRESIRGNETQVDHILPISRSFDNSYFNKVLCVTKENADKKNRTPYEYMDGNKFEALKLFATKLPKEKQRRLLNQYFGQPDQEEAWKSSALNDTRYLTRTLKNGLERSFPTVKIEPINGQITSYLRSKWGLPKDREVHTHHAVDAVILSCVGRAMVQTITLYHQDIRRNKHEEKPWPQPWKGFREELLEKVDGIFITRSPQRKITGALHNETFQRHNPPQGKEKIALVALTKEKLERLVEKDGRSKKLYEVLKQRLEAYDYKPEKAFKEPIRMPTGETAKQKPLIQSVMVEVGKSKNTSAYAIDDTRLVENLGQARIDVFRHKEKYRISVERKLDLLQSCLSDRVITRNRQHSDWTKIDETFDFQFSVYPDDLICIQEKKDSPRIYGYYKTTDISVGLIKVASYNRGIKQELRIPFTNALSIEKYSISYLGILHKVSREQRIPLA